VLHFQKTSDSSDDTYTTIIDPSSVRFLKADHPEKVHAPLQPITQEHRKALLHKILLLCDLVIHVKARMLKAKAKTKASNPRSRSRPRPRISIPALHQDICSNRPHLCDAAQNVTTRSYTWLHTTAPSVCAAQQLDSGKVIWQTRHM